MTTAALSTVFIPVRSRDVFEGDLLILESDAVHGPKKKPAGCSQPAGSSVLVGDRLSVLHDGGYAVGENGESRR
jgi:hypothetical protein